MLNKSKRVCSVYFSPTGGTKKVVNTISSVLGDKLSLPVEIFDFTLPKERENPLVFNSDDIVVIGTPVYAGRVPNVLLKFLDTIKGEGATAIPVVVFGNRNYDEALCELSEICKKIWNENNNSGRLCGRTCLFLYIGQR